LSIELIRLDDRLIHGQLVAGWVKALYATSIVVLDNDTANDPFQQSLMRMAVPENVDVYVFAVSQCKEFLRQLGRSNKRIIVLFSRVSDVYEAYTACGLPLKVLNVGGVRFKEGRRQILESLYLSDQEIEMLQQMAQNGVRVEVRPTPFDKAIDFVELVRGDSAGQIKGG